MKRKVRKHPPPSGLTSSVCGRSMPSSVGRCSLVRSSAVVEVEAVEAARGSGSSGEEEARASSSLFDAIVAFFPLSSAPR